MSIFQTEKLVSTHNIVLWHNINSDNEKYSFTLGNLELFRPKDLDLRLKQNPFYL